MSTLQDNGHPSPHPHPQCAQSASAPESTPVTLDTPEAPITDTLAPTAVSDPSATLQSSIPTRSMHESEQTIASNCDPDKLPGSNDPVSGPPTPQHCKERVSEDGLTLSDLLEAIKTRIAQRDERETTLVAVGVGLIAIRYCLPGFNWATILVGLLGVGVGAFGVAFFLLSAPEATRHKRASTLAQLGLHRDQQLALVDGVPTWSTVSEKEPCLQQSIKLPETNTEEYSRVAISDDIDPMFEEMITFALRDFVNVPVGLVSVGQHNIPLRASMVAMVMNLSKRLSSMRLPETALLGVFGLQNSFIVHLRAYRELRASKMPIEEYVRTHANPDSVLGRCYHKEERLKQFRSTAKAVCQALLSRNDQQSKALFAVMQEIMATHVLESTLDHICDPDFINMSIIEYFSAPLGGGTKQGAGSVAEAEDETRMKQAVETSTAQDAPMNSLADSILLNAARLMDDSGYERQSSDPNLRPETNVPSAQPQRSGDGKRPSTRSTMDDRTVTASRPPATPTLRNVLTDRNNHMDLYQEFMAYLQVWDAMDLAQFWLMIDIFHRQIEQGMLSDFEDIQREADNIFMTYCGPDLDKNVTGIRDAKSGNLLKSLKKNMQRNPATCLQEAQEWALSTLEAQYWVPFEMKRTSQSTSNTGSARTSSVEEGSLEANHVRASVPQSTTPPPVPISVSTPPLDDDIKSQMPPVVARPIIEEIYLSDMVHRRPKTLMSNADLSYMVEVQTRGGQGWMVTRTFQQLEQLQLALIQQFPVVQRTVFPRWRLQPSDKVCNGLQNFLQAMLKIPEVKESDKFSWFLSKEFDQSPDGVTPGATTAGAVFGSNGSLATAFSPLADQSKATFGIATQGAKTALRQASEASLTAGRFFKSLGGVVSSSSPQLLGEDRNSRGSFESIRSTRSINSLVDQLPPVAQQPHQVSPHGLLSAPPTPAPRKQPIPQENDTPQTLNGRTGDIYRADAQRSDITPIGSPELHSEPLVAINAGRQTRPLDASGASQDMATPGPRAPSRSSTMQSSLSSSPSLLPHQAPTVPVLDSSNLTASATTCASPKDVSAPMDSALPTSVSPPVVKPPPRLTLLSNDELDLLIETTFTVLEDMMDFSKGQSIRRMAFGVLRELVRKSYRAAINQTFSEWVKQNTSHESAVELVRWMKDDLLWPNGEWPLPESVAADTAKMLSSGSGISQELLSQLSSTSSGMSNEEKDYFQVGEDQYEVGRDGIAVKVMSSSRPPSIAESTTSATTLATSATAPVSSAQVTPVKDQGVTAPVNPTPLGARTLQEKEATRDKARELVKMMLPGSLVTVLGKEAVLRGLVDVFELFQIKELNLGLALSVLEMTIRLVLTR
ncbi:hypothetical protein BGW38_008956 [Lunasporangiospora selenospora]|uniref:PXA domain-containing protein n=1 Tax=Lunasporangiospora selenospora TaxID=979761 RepID=A0A9P6KGD1_9FUNG|nr:hypothetical protein BGW38_008956 [Lunasporangiospora selenospora]